MRRRRLVCGLLVVVLAGCQGAGALWVRGKPRPYQGSLLELFGKIRRQHRAVRSGQLEFEVKVTEAGTTRVRRGTAWVRAASVRLEEEVSYQPLGGASTEVRVTNGRQSWVYRADDGTATVQALTPKTREQLAGRVVRYGPLALVLDVPVPAPNMQVQEVPTPRGKQIRIETTQGSPGSGRPWIRRTFWVDAEDLLVRRMEVKGARPQGGRLLNYRREHRYWNYELNPDLSDDLFRFTPPTGTRIEKLPPR